ncbi:hypothetical protein RB653_010067 [Dictyostelium firmibasis]|uniref:Uncharacterized protein n=1 Tax=Dictyostelium firmibasis TaxID=79012 RepID=A0AAN7TT67_9MYCE
MLFRQHEKLSKYDYFNKLFKKQYKDKDGKAFDVQVVPIIIGAFGRIITEETSHTENEISHQIKPLKDCINNLPLPDNEKKLLQKLPRLAVTGTVLSLQSWLNQFKTATN